jgi:DNA end-binding protein Ku
MKRFVTASSAPFPKSLPKLELVGLSPSRRTFARGLRSLVMRAIWKGSISFSLVNIPISLYPATKSEELKFRMLRKTDLSPINYKRVAEADGKEVPWEHIVKGYEYEKGKYVILKDEDFKRADVEATQSVEIVEFVQLEEIDPIFFDRPYYLEPQKKGEKAYVLLREALKKSKKVGIAKVVIKTRQHLASIKPEKDALVLELMHFADELIDWRQLQIPGHLPVGAKELDMAAELINRMTGKWDANKYTDDYKHALLDLIQKKIEHGGQTPEAAPADKRKTTNVIDLVSVLQESLTHAGKSTHAKKQKKERKHLKKAA